MAGIISVIIILLFSILITRVASIALTHTGLSRESSKFQARSAFTGVGFTTDESEKVVNHPVRRKILLLLMILGNAGIISGVASLIIGFTGIDNSVDTWVKIGALVSGIVLLWYFANSRWVDKQLSYIINKILKKAKKLDVKDYSSLLHLSGEFRISEVPVESDNWLCGKKIKQTKLRDEGLNILAVTRNDGTFIGTPDGNTPINDGDSLIIYGRAEVLHKLESRLKGSSGNREHNAQTQEQKEVHRKEQKEDQSNR